MLFNMSNTYSQIILQIVFSVKFRKPHIQNTWKEALHAVIASVINKKQHRCLIVNSVPDHIHILVSMRPYQSISDLVREIKVTSCSWINEHTTNHQRGGRKFRWQEGFSVFSYHTSMKDKLYNYVLNQEKHHSKKSLTNEFVELMQNNELDFDPVYAGEFLMEDAIHPIISQDQTKPI